MRSQRPARVASKIEFDIYCGDSPRAPHGHPNEEGHSITAMRIINEDLL